MHAESIVTGFVGRTSPAIHGARRRVPAPAMPAAMPFGMGVQIGRSRSPLICAERTIHFLPQAERKLRRPPGSGR